MKNTYSSIEVLSKIKEIKAIPLFYHDNPVVATQIVKACYQAGARVIEFTHRGENALDVFRYMQSEVRGLYPDLILGIGSLKTADQASRYLMAGAHFIVTPVLREDIAHYCNKQDVLWLAGCGTVTEIARAEDLGAKMVKLFPASIYGPAFVKAVKGPQPWTQIMATGGVGANQQELKSWFEAGVSCVGLGSQLLSKELIDKGDYQALCEKVKESIDFVKRLV